MAKIVDRQEVIRWFEEGRTYAWMSEQYLEKYNIEMSLSAWGNFRRREGLDRRHNRDDDLIPWAVKLEHRQGWAVQMLRAEARRRARMEITPEREHEVDTWIAGLHENNTVVHYDPDTDQGWFYVPRRPDIDTDLIRKPDRKTTTHRAAD